MKTLKYTLIKNEVQYQKYCNALEQLVDRNHSSDLDEIELLTLLIEKWDESHNTLDELDPVQLLKQLMNDHHLIAKDLTEILNLSKGTISKMLNYQKGFSKDAIRNLSAYFKVSQEAFNRPYKLQIESERIALGGSPRHSQRHVVTV